VLLLFAIMLTREVHRGNPFNRLKFPTLIVCGLLLAALVSVFVTTSWGALPQGATVPVGDYTTTAIGRFLFNRDHGFILPFEIAAMVLLAAIIGAIVLVREK
jgi:NADH-quinone oxidoreductase subunit J